MIKPFEITTLATEALTAGNLIEASAGTGKTYSIALLALRLVMEKDIPIQQVLMVTFTNAAVAELQERVRKFLVLANNFSEGENIDNNDIALLVNNAMEAYGHTIVKERLKASLLLMDEAVIVTIHSFCQQILNKYAFETKQIFGAVLQNDISEIVTDEVNKFWRKHITTLSVDALLLLNTDNLKPALLELIKKHFAGKHYAGFSATTIYEIDDAAILNTVNDLANDIEIASEAVSFHFKKYFKAIEEVVSKKKSSILFKTLQNLNDWIKAVNESLHHNKNTTTIEALPPSVIEAIAKLTALEVERTLVQHRITQQVKFAALSIIPASIEERLKRSNILTFDDLIKNLHKAVMQQPANEALLANVRKDFKAVFIDEFQDTDQIQFEIFKKLFIESPNTITFLIGDPKQSIYAFRGADVEAYLNASKIVSRQYTMDKNFRSTQQMVTAAEKFFLPYENFNTFYYPQNTEGIKFTKVTAHQKNGALLYNNEPTPAIEIFSYRNKPAIQQNIAHKISSLLNNKGAYRLQDKDGTARAIKPADIGVLVRSAQEGRSIKILLDALNIPSVQVNDDKVLKDDIAADISYILTAVVNPTLSNIRQALFTPLTGWSVEDLEQMDNEVISETFRAYQQLWEHQSVYELLSKVKTDFNLENVLLKKPGGQRMLANFIHIMQLLHQRQTRKGLSPEELLMWLNKSRQGLENDGDEYQLQIESDEEAVKIVTIHKSKGLEYNIVFCPNLSFSRDLSKNSIYAEFKHAQHGATFVDAPLITAEELAQYQTQQEQENRRLMYVAVTRAVYKCYIAFSTHQFGENNSSLYPFYEAISGNEIAKISAPEFDGVMYESEANNGAPTIQYAFDSININGINWRKMSYTALAEKRHGKSAEKQQTTVEGYDAFAFEQLAPGSRTGNLLHFLFENIDFNSELYWDKSIAKALNRFAHNNEIYAPHLPQLIQHVVKAVINFKNKTFSLSQIPVSHCLKEMEFNFHVKKTMLGELQSLLSQEAVFAFALSDTAVLEGFLNGFIDLFFEHDGKYYILDWKSNFLGNTHAAYAPEKLFDAMSENNYHLQYLIYTLAAHKYLKSRLPHYDYDKNFGGIIYMFLRGVRQGSTSGVFTTRFNKKVIENIDRLVTPK